MKLLLVGGRQKTRALVKSLKEKRHRIVVVNNDYEWCKLLSSMYGVICVHGDLTKPFILEDAGIQGMDTVIALTNNDANNLVICQIAKKRFKVPRTIAIVNEPKNMQVFLKLGVDKCVSSTKTISDIVEAEAVFEEIKEYMPLENGKIVCVEMTLTEKSPAANKVLSILGLPEGCIIGCVIRGEQTFVPRGNTKIKPGDKLVLLSTPEAVELAGETLLGKHAKAVES